MRQDLTSITRQPDSRIGHIFSAGADLILILEPLWVTALVLPLLFLPSFDPAWGNLALLGSVLGLLPWALRRIQAGYFTRRTPFDLIFVLLLFSALIGFLPARLLQSSLARFWVYVGCITFFYLEINHASQRYLKGYLIFSVMVGLIISIALVTQLPVQYTYPWGERALALLEPLLAWLYLFPKISVQDSRFFSVNRNAIAGACMVTLPLIWPMLHMSRHRLVKIMVLLLAAPLIFLLVFSAGISAVLALGAAWVLMMFLVGRIYIAFIAGFALLTSPVLMITLWPESALVDYVLTNLAGRFDIWQSALNLIRSAPLLGAGLGMQNWFLALPDYALPVLLDKTHTHPLPWVLHAHNFYLQTWAEQGILGFVALIAMVALALWLGATYFRSARGFRRALVFGSLWSFTAYAINSLVDAGPSTPAAFALWAALGLMVAAGQPPRNQTCGQIEIPPSYRKQAKPRHIKASTVVPAVSRPWLGTTAWLGIALYFTLLGLAAIRPIPLLGLGSATAAGLSLAMAAIHSHKRQAQVNIHDG